MLSTIIHNVDVRIYTNKFEDSKFIFVLEEKMEKDNFPFGKRKVMVTKYKLFQNLSALNKGD